MPAPDAEFAAHCVELLGHFGRARARRMFGGHGLYLDDLFVALIAGGMLYLKADAQTQDAFAAAGSQPFEYAAAGGRRTVMGYWSAPSEACESAELLDPWIGRAVDAALRARAAAPPSARRARGRSPSPTMPATKRRATR
jgi:DNA transformation protein